MQAHATEEIERSETADREGEYRIFGPPGTGKTTYLSRQIGHAAQRFGPDRVLVTSFSRAAAAELTGRSLDLPKGAIGTLHAHCWRALGGPKIAESDVKEWNHEHPEYSITPAGKSPGKLDDYGGDGDLAAAAAGNPGDQMLMKISRRRALEHPVTAWHPEQQKFWAAWQDYKKESGTLDFTDLIDIALRDVHVAPGNPAVIFADEAQDLTPMQLKLIRRWGQHADYFILAGDDDQLIYPHLGCIPEGLLDPPLPPDRSIVLSQSYRVPEAVRVYAEQWILNVHRRQPKRYDAREGAQGALDHSPICLANLFPLRRIITDAQRAGETLMILTTCNFQLARVLKELREMAITFHNPYRLTNGGWNPLAPRKGGGLERLRALLAAHPAYGGRFWTQAELARLVDWMASGTGALHPGAKAWVKRHATGTQPATAQMLREVFTPEALLTFANALEHGPERLVMWWLDKLLMDHQMKLGFAQRIMREHGLRALERTPSVIVGTIHSVKGGEADRVLVFPDLSPAAYQDSSGEGMDKTLRVFYVGMTRARERLILATPSGPLAVGWNTKAGWRW